MSAQTTPAVERAANALAARALITKGMIASQKLNAQVALSAALDVEEMTAEADQHFVSAYDGGNTVCNCGAIVAPGKGPRHIVTAVRAAILGGAA